MVGESVVPHVERGGVPVFEDVVAAGPDRVRAEFDEIVTANFPASSTPPLRRHPRASSPPGTRQPVCVS